MKKRITIDPITRLEGHGKIEIFLNDEGDVENTYFQIPELRGFEKFCEGRPVEEVARIVPRICGVCPVAHHLAAAKALDGVYSVDPPRTAKMLRELMYSAQYVHSHIAHFYALAAPDFVLGPDAKPEERNILGVVGKVGLEKGGEVIKHRAYAQKVQGIIGSKPTHPITGIPGGQSKGITAEERDEILKMGESCVEFAKFSLDLFEEIVLKNKTYLDIITGDIYKINTYYMGLVDENNKANFYEGKIRVVDQEGTEVAKFEPNQYLDYIEERVEPWTYLKIPYLKSVGWNGFTDGKDSGIYQVAPLGRANVIDGMATPLAQEAYEKMISTLGGKKPITASLVHHWARLVEMLYAAERWVELASDEEIISDNFRTIPTATPNEGVGVVEAPRGTLIHHYKADEAGLATKINLIVGTTNNYGAINLSVKRAAEKLIKKGKVDQGLLNMVEMAFRAYDPCFSCATHSITGNIPLEVEVYESSGKLCQKLVK
ncbi:F420-non-reducing hydrogenase large subunit [Desulfitispora alkaliphila]|uniref:Ni/Fe hydrogenase subunit alpha n=1 Tax=Desulfitispora alkaliphila TaxID=622674 RepID=UPI003D253BE5